MRRFTHSREFNIPQDAQKIAAADSSAVAYLAPYVYRAGINEGRSAFHAVAFSGKRNKPDWNHTFRTEEQARAYITEHASNTKAHETRTLQRRADRSNVRAADHYKVGDILRTSWGYDQTNVEFFKIVRVLEKAVEVVAIGARSTPDSGCGPMSGYTSPNPDVILTGWEAEHNGVKRVKGDGNGGASVRIHRHSNGYKTKVGESHYESWYA